MLCKSMLCACLVVDLYGVDVLSPSYRVSTLITLSDLRARHMKSAEEHSQQGEIDSSAVGEEEEEPEESSQMTYSVFKDPNENDELEASSRPIVRMIPRLWNIHELDAYKPIFKARLELQRWYSDIYFRGQTANLPMEVVFLQFEQYCPSSGSNTKSRGHHQFRLMEKNTLEDVDVPGFHRMHWENLSDFRMDYEVPHLINLDVSERSANDVDLSGSHNQFPFYIPLREVGLGAYGPFTVTFESVVYTDGEIKK